MYIDGTKGINTLGWSSVKPVKYNYVVFKLQCWVLDVEFYIIKAIK